MNYHAGLKIETIAHQARQMREKGMSWQNIGLALGVAADTVQRSVDPEYAVRRRAMNKASRRGDTPMVGIRRVETGADVARDAERLMAQIPADTRTLTSRLLGDPLPGRSALDQRG